MKQGICTNQPSLCPRAAARVLMPMPAPDTRCPEPGCGKPLLPAPGGGGRERRSPLVPVLAAVAALGAAGGAGYAVLHSDGKAGDGKEKQRPEPAPVVPPKPPVGDAPSRPGMPAVTAPTIEVPKTPEVPKTSSKQRQGSRAGPPTAPADPCAGVSWEGIMDCNRIRKCFSDQQQVAAACGRLSREACSRIRICVGGAPVDGR